MRKGQEEGGVRLMFSWQQDLITLATFSLGSLVFRRSSVEVNSFTVCNNSHIVPLEFQPAEMGNCMTPLWLELCSVLLQSIWFLLTASEFLCMYLGLGVLSLRGWFDREMPLSYAPCWYNC